MHKLIRLACVTLASPLVVQTITAQQGQLVIDQTQSSCVPGTTANTHECTFEDLGGI